MRKKHLSGSLIGISILFLSVGSVMPQGVILGDGPPFVFDFPTFVDGAGNSTDVYMDGVL